MIKRFISTTTRNLIIISLISAISINMLLGIKDYLTDITARKNGLLTEIVATDEIFQKESMRQHRSMIGWSATDTDPKLILETPMVFTGIEFYMEYSMYPGEMLLYFTTAEQPEYSNTNMAVITPVKDKNGWFSVTIPATEITSLRIDPTWVAGNHLVFGDFIINPEQTLIDYLAPTGYTVLFTGVYSLALFAIFSFVKDFFTKKSK